jgi:phospholipid/cholesterol/gamma-HCH transport system substrate-binding protein
VAPVTNVPLPTVTTPPVSLPGLPEVPPITLSPEQMLELIPAELLARINQYAYVNSAVPPAPPCRRQGPYDFGGERTQYPHVRQR